MQSCTDESITEQPPLPTPRAELEARGGFQDDGTLFIYTTEEEEEQRDSLTILGRLRNNPFTVENMSNAYRALWNPNAHDLNATHRYIGNWPVRVNSNLNRMHIVMPNVGGRRSRSQVWYHASHMLNGVMRARDLSIEKGIPAPPDNLRAVMSHNNEGAGAAPMFKSSGTSVAIVFSSCAVANAFFTPTVGASSCVIFTAASRLIPDVWQNYGNNCPAASGSSTTNVYMHELGHALH